MTGLSFVRGGYHRIGRSVGAGRRRLHRAPPGSLAVRRAPASAAATCSARPAPSSATSATAASCASSTACPSPPAPTAARRARSCWRPRRRAVHPRQRAQRPVADDDAVRGGVQRVAGARGPRRGDHRAGSSTVTRCWPCATASTARARSSPPDAPTGSGASTATIRDQPDHAQPVRAPDRVTRLLSRPC